jgi:hypothetical protein
MVSIDVAHLVLGKWSRRSPCLETYEVEALGAWFREVASGIDKPRIAFTEPNLSFELVDREDETMTLAVLLKEEFTLWPPKEETRIEIPFLTPPELSAASAYLEERLTVFPKR